MPRTKSKNPLHTSILGFFQESPRHGYELYKEIKKDSAFSTNWHLKQSQFYALLDRFYQEGFLEIRIKEGDTYPDRKEFRLTDTGREAFRDWQVSPVLRGREMRQEFLAKLYFALKNSPATANQLIQIQREQCLTWINELPLESSEETLFWSLMIDYRREQMEAMVNWLDIIERKLPKDIG